VVSHAASRGLFRVDVEHLPRIGIMPGPGRQDGQLVMVSKCCTTNYNRTRGREQSKQPRSGQRSLVLDLCFKLLFDRSWKHKLVRTPPSSIRMHVEFAGLERFATPTHIHFHK
jgi:hypothetical protein